MRYEKSSDQGNLFDFIELEQVVASRSTPLSKLDSCIDWEAFLSVMEEALNYKHGKQGGRPAKNPVMMMKMCILQSMYNLSDEEVEWQATDRLSFRQFLGLNAGERVPDARTLWLFKERLGKRGVKALFEAFHDQMQAQGLKHREGKIVDATILEVPRQRNSREENQMIKAGQKPEAFDENPHRARQKDTDARWLTKRGKHYYGYKNHTKVDILSKLVDSYECTDASVHDSQVVEQLTEEGDGYWFGDSAYAGQPVLEHLNNAGIESFIHSKANRNGYLSPGQKKLNKGKSQIRARVEHVYGWIFRKGKILIRTIGHERAERSIGWINLTYNMNRWTYLAGGTG